MRPRVMKMCVGSQHVVGATWSAPRGRAGPRPLPRHHDTAQMARIDRSPKPYTTFIRTLHPNANKSD